MQTTKAGGEVQAVREVVADPGPLGLIGLAIVTLVASTEKLGWTTGTAFVLPWAIFLGAAAQLAAAAYDFKRNNILGSTVFGAYGLFWMGVGMTWMIKLGMFGQFATPPDAHQLGVAFVGFLIFSVAMSVAALETTKVLFATFLCIDVLFVGLSMNLLATGEVAEFGHTMAGYAELATSALAFYGCAAGVINQHVGRTILALGKPFGVLKGKPVVAAAAKEEQRLAA
jgi:uncharacterized protein